MSQLLSLVPIALFFIVLLTVGFVTSYRANRAAHFKQEYFLGSQNLGGIVLALTLVATYGSVSSFVSGPGIAWNLGYGWVVFAAPQIITGFLILGLVGKRMTILAHRTSSLTVVDILFERFGSKVLCFILALMLIIFFIAMIVGQFIGGAQIFAALTGLDYSYGLILFALVTVLYSSGGFRAVALTDAICAGLMLLGMFILGYVILKEGHGMEQISQTLSQVNLDDAGRSKNLQFNAGGALPLTLLFSAWILVGFATVGLPQSLVRCMSYKSSAELHKAMIIATVVCGALMIGMTMLGVLARAVIVDMPAGGTDRVIPNLITEKMHPLVAGFTILGPLAATMSTVSSLLIAAASAIIRDLFKALNKQSHPVEESAVTQNQVSTSNNHNDGQIVSDNQSDSNNQSVSDRQIVSDNQSYSDNQSVSNNSYQSSSRNEHHVISDTACVDLAQEFSDEPLTNTATKSALTYHEKLIVRGSTMVIGLIAIILALYPLDVVAWINLFAFGGLESAFVWPIILGLFSKKTNLCGVFCSIAASLSVYTVCSVFKLSFMSFHAIVPSLVAGLIAAVIGNMIGRLVLHQKMPISVHHIFFPHRKFED